MKSQRPFSMMAALMALHGGSIFATRGVAGDYTPRATTITGGGGYSCDPRPKRRKNPFRGMTYSSHFIVNPHV